MCTLPGEPTVDPVEVSYCTGSVPFGTPTPHLVISICTPWDIQLHPLETSNCTPLWPPTAPPWDIQLNPLETSNCTPLWPPIAPPWDLQLHAPPWDVQLHPLETFHCTPWDITAPPWDLQLHPLEAPKTPNSTTVLCKFYDFVQFNKPWTHLVL